MSDLQGEMQSQNPIADVPLLAKPFQTIFSSPEQANQALDFLRDTAIQLGAKGADDKRFALTLPSKHYPYVLRLNYGNWVVVNFEGKHGEQEEMALLALIQEQIPPKYQEYISGQPFSSTLYIFG